MAEVYTLTDSMYWTMKRLDDAVEQAGVLRAQVIGDSLRMAQLAMVFDAPAPPDTSRRGAPAAAAPNPAAGLPRERGTQLHGVNRGLMAV